MGITSSRRPAWLVLVLLVCTHSYGIHALLKDPETGEPTGRKAPAAKVAPQEFDRSAVVPREVNQLKECTIPYETSEFPKDRLEQMKARMPVVNTVGWDTKKGGREEMAIALRHLAPSSEAIKGKVLLNSAPAEPLPFYYRNALDGAKLAAKKENITKDVDEWIKKKADELLWESFFGPGKLLDLVKKQGFDPAKYDVGGVYTVPVKPEMRAKLEGILLGDETSPAVQKALSDAAFLMVTGAPIPKNIADVVTKHRAALEERIKNNKLVILESGASRILGTLQFDRQVLHPIAVRNDEKEKKTRHPFNTAATKGMDTLALFKGFSLNYEMDDFRPAGSINDGPDRDPIHDTRIAAWVGIDGFEQGRLRAEAIDKEVKEKKSNLFTERSPPKLAPLDPSLKPVKIGFGHMKHTIAEYRKDSLVLHATDPSAKTYLYSSQLLPSKDKPPCDVWTVPSQDTTVLFDDATGAVRVYRTPKELNSR